MRGPSVLWERVASSRGECTLSSRGRPLFHRSITVNTPLSITLSVDRRLGAFGVLLCIGKEGEKPRVKKLSFCGLSGKCELYRATLSFRESGLLFYDFCVNTKEGALFSDRDALGQGMCFSCSKGLRHHQLTVTEFLYPEPKWLLGGVIYHVFVDRFARGGRVPKREDAVYNPDWEGGCPEYPAYPGAPLKNNEFFGGTLWGIADKIPYLASLGVRLVYLSPIFEAYSNHKYDTGDYRKIDEMFGGKEAFSHLIGKASSYGIRLLLDGVFNHTGDDSVYFNRYGRYGNLGAYQSQASPYYGWYRFSRYPDEYTAWWGISILPRIHPSESESCREFFVGKEGVIASYARLGIGGFRLDVVDELADGFVADIRARLHENGHACILYGEVWEDASNKVAYGVRKRYYGGSELDGVMNYPLREGLIAYFRKGETDTLFYALCEVLPNMPKRIADLTMNLLGTHDTVRILTALTGEDPAGHTNEELALMRLSSEERRRGIRLLKMAYLSLATLPGLPTVYYGDEVGLEGYADPLNRRPFPWHRMEKELLDAYRQIGALRRREAVYRRGEFRLLHLSKKHLIFSRSDQKRTLFTVINRSGEDLILRFEKPVREALFGTKKGTEILIGKESGTVLAAPKKCKLFFTK